VLDLIELILDGALPGLAEVLREVGAADVRELVARVDPAAPGPDGAGPWTVEDAEGTPVARLDPDLRLTRLLPFSHPPLRAHRRAPVAVEPVVPSPEVASAVARPVQIVMLTGIPSLADVTEAIAAAASGGRDLVWLLGFAPGDGPLPAEAAWRAAAGLVAQAGDAGVGASVVPVALPRLDTASGANRTLGQAPEPGGAKDGQVWLIEQVAAGYARPLGAAVRILPELTIADGDLPADLPPSYRAELLRTRLPAHRRGLTVFFTGLSGSGKSTLAKRLAARLLESGSRTVTLLDGDEVRRLLSGGLGFSRADRDLNIRRIGFVAAEVGRHGGVVICAPIAPFEQVRAQVRAMVQEAGGNLVLIHVATPLAECERRDRKGLYARARRGEIPDFTGISSPYEVPLDADLAIDTTGLELDAGVDRVWQLLRERGYLADPMATDPMATDPMAADPMAADPMAADPMAAGSPSAASAE
jgi:sulfate adenylyltransferase